MTATSPTVEAPPAPWRPPSPLPESCESERLVIRYWRPEHAPAMLAALDVDRSSFLPHLPWTAVDNLNVAQCTYKIEQWRRDRERSSPPVDEFVLGIFDRSTGDVVGGTGLHRIRLAIHQAEIGYWVRPDRRSTGLCTEAVRALIGWAFSAQDQGGWGLRRIEILCAGSNGASQAVPRKLGLREEVRLRAHRWLPGIGWDDTLGWGVLASEWADRSPQSR
jgi:RimJ/RimL family protein N-acetyltransferase